jgi:hypothetical protein
MPRRPGWSLPEPVQYKFTEFPHFETRKNEALFREYVKACEQSPACWSEPYTASSAERTTCVRACISQACYTQVLVMVSGVRASIHYSLEADVSELWVPGDRSPCYISQLGKAPSGPVLPWYHASLLVQEDITQRVAGVRRGPARGGGD